MHTVTYIHNADQGIQQEEPAQELLAPSCDLFDTLKDKRWDLRCTREFKEKLYRMERSMILSVVGVLSRLADGERHGRLMKMLAGSRRCVCACMYICMMASVQLFIYIYIYIYIMCVYIYICAYVVCAYM